MSAIKGNSCRTALIHGLKAKDVENLNIAHKVLWTILKDDYSINMNLLINVLIFFNIFTPTWYLTTLLLVCWVGWGFATGKSEKVWEGFPRFCSKLSFFCISDCMWDIFCSQFRIDSLDGLTNSSGSSSVDGVSDATSSLSSLSSDEFSDSGSVFSMSASKLICVDFESTSLNI